MIYKSALWFKTNHHTHDTYIDIYPIDIIEFVSGIQDKNGQDIYESNIVRLDGFRRPRLIKYDNNKGFIFFCKWGEDLCRKEFGDNLMLCVNSNIN